MRKLIVFLLLAVAGPAFGQSVQQSGTVTRGHLPYWVTSGVVGDGGSAADSPISTIGATGPICSNSARQSSGAWNSLCLQANTSSAATLTLQNYGTASAQSLEFIINGTAQGIPTVTPLPVIAGNVACFNNTSGTLKDCGLAATSLPLAKARMWPSINQVISATAPWNAVDPWGNAISCAGTNSQCLQEFFNVTTASGWPAEVDCQGTHFPGGAEPITIQSSASVTVPVAQDWSFHSYGCNLNFNLATASGLIFDSQGATEFDWDGKIVYNPTAPNGNTTTNPSCAVLFQPTTNTADGFAGIYAGHIRIKNPVSNPVGATQATGTVCYNAANGTLQNHMEFEEINGVGKTFYGFLAFGSTSQFGVMGSQIRILQSHGHINSQVQIGTTTTNQTLYRNNQWYLNSLGTAGATSAGVDTYGEYDTFQIENIAQESVGFQYGIKFETGSAYNQSQYGQIVSPSGANVLDNGSGNQYTGLSNITGYALGIQISTPQFIGTNAGAGKAAPFVAQAGGQTGYAWANTASPTDTKWWDCVVNGSTVFQCRTVNDAQAVANAWLQVTRSGTTISSVQFGDGTHYATVPIAANDTLVGRATTDTLTNKTLTSPIINTSTVTGGTLASLTSLGLTSGSNINWNSDTYLGRAAAAKLMLGQADAAAPVAQILSVQNVVAGTSNTAGANLIVAGSQGTGTGAGGSIFLQVAPSGTTGTSQNALVTGASLITSSTAPGGTTWAQGVGVGAGYVPWANAVSEWRTGTNQRFSLGATNLLATGVSVNVFNDAVSTNLGLEFRASPTGFTQGGVCISNGAACTDPGAGFISLTGALVSKGTSPVGTTGSCVASSFVGGATAGKFSAAVCVAGTIILSALPTAPNGYTCNAQDQTTPADTLQQTGNTTTSATFKATTVASDVVVFQCTAW